MIKPLFQVWGGKVKLIGNTVYVTTDITFSVANAIHRYEHYLTRNLMFSLVTKHTLVKLMAGNYLTSTYISNFLTTTHQSLRVRKEQNFIMYHNSQLIPYQFMNFSLPFRKITDIILFHAVLATRSTTGEEDPQKTTPSTWRSDRQMIFESSRHRTRTEFFTGYDVSHDVIERWCNER